MDNVTIYEISSFWRSCNCSSSCNETRLVDLYTNNYYNKLQNKLDAPTPWIGLYIAAASAVCALAIATDALIGFRSRRLWFPCKYFSLNAFFLTVLAVAMKLPLDLTSLELSSNDSLVRLSSLVLMSTAMSNFVTSLGSMTNNEIILNLAALVLLVITISGNIWVHMKQLHHYHSAIFVIPQFVTTFCMFVPLFILCFTAVMLPTAKRYIDLSYHEMHKKVSNKQVEWGEFSVDQLRVAVRRYWVMAQTGSSQFVIARSVTCATSGFMCLLLALNLLQNGILAILGKRQPLPSSSSYKWSVNVILAVQSIAVALSTIAPVVRWFIAAHIKSSKIGHQSLKEEFKVETYWTQMLVYWRDQPMPLHAGRHISRKLLHDAKRFVLNLCIGVQIVIVLSSKATLLVSAIFLKVLLFCFHPVKNLKACGVEESISETESNYRGYVLLLEGEPELPQKTLTNISKEVDKLIKKGGQKQPKNLIQLLTKSLSFNGVREFDSSEVPGLHPHQEPPNCWSLPVVTLTSIAISVANVADHNMLDQLLSSVREGLYFAKVIEKSLCKNEDLEGIRHAADVVWGRVELSKKWLDNDLQTASLRGTYHKETLQNLSTIAEDIITDFMTRMNDPMMQNPVNWPVKIIAAHSMYRITQTILRPNKDDDSLTDDEFFEKLLIMISDIFVACLTNLVSVITLKCHSNAIEEREESVGQAAILLGETEEILQMLQNRSDLPSLDPKKAADIDEWRRALMEIDPQPSSVSPSTNDSANPEPTVEEVSILLQS